MKTKGQEVKKDATDASQGITERKTDEKAKHYSALASDDGQNPQQREASMLFSVAEEHIDEDEDYDAALKAAEDAAAIFKQLGNMRGLADAVRLVIHAISGKAADYRWNEKGNSDTNLCGQTLLKAEERAQEELDKFKEAGDKVGEGCMQLSLAELGLYPERARVVERREQSLEQATQAEELFREVGDKKFEADSMYLLASIHLIKGHFEESGRFCEGALAIYRELASRKEEAKTMHLLACSLLRGDQFTAAIAAAKDSLQIFRELELKKFIAFEAFCIAGWYVRRAQGKEALSFAKESLELFQQLDCGRGWQAGARDMVVHAQLEKGDKKLAMKLAKEGITKFADSDDKRSQILARRSLVKLQVAKDNLSDALLEAETSLEASRELEDKTMEATMLHEVAELHIMNESYDQALSAVLEAQQLCQDIGDKEQEGYVLDTVNRIHQAKGDFKMAAQVAGEQQDLYVELGDKSLEAKSLLNLSEAKANEGMLDDALASATESQAIFQDMNDKRSEGCAWNMIAAIHQANKMMDLSQQANQKMQALWTECDDDRLNALGLREVANLHLDREEPEEALKVANEARSLAKKSQNKYFEVEMLMVVADAQMACLHKIEQDTKKPAARSVLEKAMKVTKEAIVLAKKAGDKTILGWAQLKLSQMYLCHGRIEDAIKASDDASKNFKANGHEARGEILCMLSSAQAYFHLDDMSKATDLSHKAIEKAKASIDPEHEYAANEILQAIQAKQGGGRPHQEVEQDSMPQQSVQQIQSSAQPLAKPALDPVVVTQMVRETLAASIGSDDDVHMDTPLMEAGMDSLSMVAFRNQLQRQSGISMPASVMFDYPSMITLVDHLVDSSRG